jgi:TFIIF-interacting CTD phosphatase-like protein
MYEEPQELKEFNPEATLNEAGAAPSNLEYKRSNQEILRENQVEIIFLSVGCVIKVGCKEIPFFNKYEAIAELKEYITSPKTVIERWMKIFDKA